MLANHEAIFISQASPPSIRTLAGNGIDIGRECPVDMWILPAHGHRLQLRPHSTRRITPHDGLPKINDFLDFNFSTL